MFSDSEIADGSAAQLRLSSGKLTDSDVSDIVGWFRTVLGPIETRDKMELKETLQSLDDSANDKKLAVKMAAGLIRLKNEDFGVSILQSDLENSDEEQRRLFIIAMMSLLWKLPAELAYFDPLTKSYMMFRRTTSTARLVTRP